jgi:hypothetical protein
MNVIYAVNEEFRYSGNSSEISTMFFSTREKAENFILNQTEDFKHLHFPPNYSIIEHQLR